MNYLILNLRKVIEPESILIYYKDGSVQINLDNILTIDHLVFPHMKVLKNEGNYFNPFEILGIYDDNYHVYLTIKNINTGKVNVISQKLDRDNKYFLWSIISLEYFHMMLENRIMARLIVGNTCESNYCDSV